MQIFIPIFVLVFIIMIIAHAIYVYINSKKIKALVATINSKQGEQKALLSALMSKFQKMYVYREALVSSDSQEVKDMFRKLVADEDKHLKILKKALH